MSRDSTQACTPPFFLKFAAMAGPSSAPKAPSEPRSRISPSEGVYWRMLPLRWIFSEPIYWLRALTLPSALSRSMTGSILPDL